jgi:uncharacterized protein (DUF169 family)
MPTIKEYNDYGKELENILGLQTSPIAVKMLKKETDIPKDAIRPKKDRGYHLAQCQAFSMSRRERTAVAMLKEDNWCPGALLSYGIVPKPDNPAAKGQTNGEYFKFGKYIGILTAPLKTAKFVPDAVIIYCDTNQLRIMLLSLKNEDRDQVKSNFFPFSCNNAVVPVILHNEYWINLPDPGEYARALTIAGEMMFSIPKERLPGFVVGLRGTERNVSGFADESMTMRPDFPQPELYKKVFEAWGMDHD